MTLHVFIDGAEGTTGLEIRERLAERSEFSLIVLDDAVRKDAGARREALNSADIAILCLPDAAAVEAVAMIEGASATRVIDASSAHRTASGWTYGFPELVGRHAVAEAARVSNPGCYPTGFLALVAPLVRAGLLPADWPYSVNAVSGYSGGGKVLIERFAGDPTLAFRSYGLDLGHKHLAEMRHHAALVHTPVFSPAVTRAYRGMIVDVPLDLAALESRTGTHIEPAAMCDALRAQYDGSAIVNVADSLPAELCLSADSVGSDAMELFVCANDGGTQVRLVARLDNLGKGAGGAAVQSLNLMAGLPEATGLRLPNPA